MAKELGENPSERELDVLLATGEQQSIALVTMALHELGVEAASITGRQAGHFHHRLATPAAASRTWIPP